MEDDDKLEEVEKRGEDDELGEVDELEELVGSKKSKPKKTKAQEFWSNVLFFAVSFVVIYVIFYVFPPYMVSGTSMNKTLDDKAFGFGFRYSSLDRGDIIVFQNENTKGDDYIKRVIGIPGDKIEIIDDDVYVNDEIIEEEYAYFEDGKFNPYGKNEIKALEDGTTASYYHYGPITLGEEEYFVLGDNRYGSSDSRAIGTVKKDDVKCRMLFFIWGKH